MSADPHVASSPSAARPVTPPVPWQVSARDLRLEFAGESGAAPVRVLDGLNFDVPVGQFLAIVGPSGCGKSTLLRVLSGLIEPTAGWVRVAGEPAAATAHRVGFMFQRDTLLPWASVADNIRVGFELAGVPPAQARERLEALLRFLRLDGFGEHRPHQISGGMRQRVALGRLLAYEPDIYLMDEPFGALDSQTKVLMGRELLRIWSAHQRTVIFVTHDIEEAVSLADRVIVLSSRPGRVRLDLSIDLERPRERAALRKQARFAEYTEQIWQALDLDPHETA
jgi:NitT/TauT family transport system ATP-binding protein